MKVRLSKLALSEFEAILTGIRAENPLAAARLEARIRRVFGRIAQFPKGAQEVENRPGIRRVPLVRYPYVIHYGIIDGDVIILRIIDGARRDPWAC
jgi:plasmid stabilization system protein ParE